MNPFIFQPNRLTLWIVPSAVGVALDFLRCKLSGQSSRLLPSLPDGIRLHVGAGQNILDGYDNLDAYDNKQRPDFFQTKVTEFVRFISRFTEKSQPCHCRSIFCEQFLHFAPNINRKALERWL